MDHGSERTRSFETLRPSMIQQIEIRTIKGFGHPWQHKKNKKLVPSSSDPVHFQVDASHENVKSMSDSDAVNISDPFQDLSHSDSLFGIEASSTSDLPQSEIKNGKRENECVHRHSEDIYGTCDNLLGDTNIGSYLEDLQNQPANRFSSLRQFEPICKFHQMEAFHDEMTFQSLTEGFSYPEKPEFQIQACNDAEDTNIKQNSLQEENPIETGISANKDRLVHECVKKSPKSLFLNYYSGETLPFAKKSLTKSTAGDTARSPSQPQILLCKENVCGNGENAFYHNSFDPLDLRVNYKTEEPEVSSKEIQTSGVNFEMPVNHQEEITEDGVESLAISSSWSPAGIFKSGGESQENSMIPGMEQSFGNIQALEEDMALNEILQKLRYTNKTQEVQIQDLQGRNLHLENKVKELQTKITKEQVFVDIINKLKENIEELIDDKYNVILEKNELSKKLQNLQEISANTKKHLQESKKEKETLQLQIKKIKVNCVHLQERYIAEIQQKNRSVNQCVEMEKTLSRKDEELERLEQLKGDLEKAATSALDMLKREKEIREQEFLSFQEEFQKREKENLKERRKLKSKVEKLIAQVKSLLFTCENERAKHTELQQQIDELRNENTEFRQQVDELKNENTELRQQVAKSEEQNFISNFKTAPLAEQKEEGMEPNIAQDIKVTHSNLILNCSSCNESLEPSPAMTTSPLATKIHSLLALMIGLLKCQDITVPDAEYYPESKANDILLQKLKCFQLKKRELDKELLKHKNRIATLKELIANEKPFQDDTTDVTDVDVDEARNVRDAPVLLAANLDKYHSLNEELDFLITKLGSLLESKEDHYSRLIEENDKYRRHVGSLINKVTSYEEIIKCADQRLEISHSQIAHLEERNRHLEDLIRLPRKPRPRIESHPKSMTLLDHLDGHCKECFISM